MEPELSTDHDVRVRVRVLGRLAAVIDARVGAVDRAVADPDDLGLIALLAADLDRHLTVLVDERYDPEDDPYVAAIERTLHAARERVSGRPVS